MSGAEGSSYKVATDVSETLRRTGALDTLDVMRTTVLSTKRADAYAKYRKDYDAAIDVKSVDSFIKTYSGSDYDSLIPSLQERRRSLLQSDYRTKFAMAQSVGDLEAFIREYAGADPEGLVPLAQQKRALELAKAERRAQREAHEARLSQAEGEIRRCNRQMTAAYEVISREKRIASISGYENTQALYQAGQTIAFCEDFIPRRYGDYRKLGGRKALKTLE